MEEKLNKLKQTLGKISDLNHASAVLGWDQQVYMPEAGALERGEQLGTIGELAHNLFVNDEVGQLLEDLAIETKDLAPDSDEARLIKVTKRQYDRDTRIPAEKIAEFARVTTVAHGEWAKARAQNQFSIFQPHLEKIVEMVREMADLFKPYDHPYDPLLDMFEPGMKTADVKQIFDTLRPQQVELVKAISESKQVDDSFLHLNFPKQAQWDFGVAIAEKFGMNWDRSRQDYAAHPFTTSFGLDDVRITTRIHEDLPASALFSTMHETGHALYELGFNRDYRRTPLADSASLAIHESQSRMWENLVGRSRNFWTHFYPQLQTAFPQQLSSVDLETFYRGINKVEPSLIRVEADEATYNLHVMLRMEIEIELMEGKLEVKDLPEVWKNRMLDYLGVAPATDADGVLQDVHWSGGMIGYFPTYALGNLVSVQLWEKMHQDMPDLDEKISKGQFAEMLQWLRTNVHQYGAKYEPQELVQRITGSKIDPKPYMRYLNHKYQDIYGF
jgi:carboxypeptidase Taq